jgi:hypothetical protein
MAQSQRARQLSLSTLPRYSKATARKMSATSTTSSGRYSEEKSEAYHSGKAAKVAAPAVISHTSLPSHTGPMVFSSTRRSVLLRANSFMSIPTPRSKPSRKRYPVHSTAMMMNQRVGSSSIRSILCA